MIFFRFDRNISVVYRKKHLLIKSNFLPLQFFDQLNKSRPVSLKVLLVSLSISLSNIWVSVSISDTGGLTWMELWTLSHSSELREDTLDQSESLLGPGTVCWGLLSLISLEKSSGKAVQELPDGSCTIEMGKVSCSHSKSNELAGVEVAVRAKRALASRL